MLSTKGITKMYKGTKIASMVELYKTTKAGQKVVKLAVQGGQCCENLQLAKFRRLRTCEICRL